MGALALYLCAQQYMGVVAHDLPRLILWRNARVPFAPDRPEEQQD